MNDSRRWFAVVVNGLAMELRGSVEEADERLEKIRTEAHVREVKNPGKGCAKHLAAKVRRVSTVCAECGELIF